MTKAEKIFFKRLSTTSGKKNLSYLELFDALDKMPEYDIVKLEKKLKGTDIFAHLSYVKNYLKRNILECLYAMQGMERRGESESDRVLSLRRELEYAHILKRKHMNEEALKIALKVKSETARLEYFPLWYLSLTLEQWLVHDNLRGGKGGQDYLLALLEEEQEFGEKLAEFSRFKVFTEKLFRARDNGDTREESELLKPYESIQLVGPNAKLNTVRGEHIRLAVLKRLYGTSGNLEDAVAISREMISLAEAHPDMWVLDNHIAALTDHLVICQKLQLVDEGNDTIKKLNKLKEQFTDRQVEIFNKSVSSLVPFFISTGQFEKAMEIEGKTMECLKDIQIETTVRVRIYCAYASMYLQLKDYDKVLNWHNLFHEDKLGQAHVRHQVTMNCIAVATHFELGNETVVESMARSCERQLSGMTIQVKIEKAFLRFLCNGLYDLPSRKEWAAFADNLITLNKRAEREDKFDFLEYFDFAEWTPQRAV